MVPYVRTTYEWDLYNQIDLEELAARSKGRWRSPPPSLTPLPPAPARLALPESSPSRSPVLPRQASHRLPDPLDTTPSPPSPSNNDVPAPSKGTTTNVDVEKIERTWAYPSAPHPTEPTLFDSYSIPSDFGVDLLAEYTDDLESLEALRASSSRTPAYPPPLRPSLPPPPPTSTDLDVDVNIVDDTRESWFGGEEFDLLDWERIEGPQTVVCWPYHGVRGRHVEWWWTMVIEKVKKPLKHL